MKLTNSEFIDCIETAKKKLKAIEQKYHPELLVYTEDLLDRMGLAIYHAVHDCIDKKLN